MAGTFRKGDVVVIPFPYTDMSKLKTRPILVVACHRGTNVIVCQITSQMIRNDEYAIQVSSKDFAKGSLPASSLVKTNMIMTLDVDTILAKSGTLSSEKMRQVEEKLIEVFTS
ncbi:type II toxin-antitoxin system PemK/MazF family toxin [Methanohalophilus sp. RSK]|uniref:type II toxin-antitoxin system PemK/MazF family toxin n=1 Tax=Methanohalophilus sp. RSK TaxID=2485783 RepID=UPI000F43B531|nr:type II toxin-antitoxin system PemK/MazF family toxin [Methanohalophilus sp. RSK]RNI15673.1 type II toxin-antitoxin system PemK/MazF family toxin [Methanohalophilus sp. RSK]